MTTYNEPRFPGPDPYEPLGNPPSFTLTSTDLADGAEIEEKFRAPSNISPQLQWSDLPEGTKSLAVTLLDPDAPTGAGFWHWAAFNIPADTTELPQGAGSAADLGIDGDISLKHDGGQREYYGPQPPAGHAPHRTCMRYMPSTWKPWILTPMLHLRFWALTSISIPSVVQSCGAGTNKNRMTG